MRANSYPTRTNVLTTCRGAAYCAPACPDANFNHSGPRDGFERASSLGGRSLPAQAGFSSDSGTFL
jgi:coenzyme F420-reducing hydrogenase gamma subunit